MISRTARLEDFLTCSEPDFILPSAMSHTKRLDGDEAGNLTGYPIPLPVGRVDVTKLAPEIAIARVPRYAGRLLGRIR
jgi:hypothetical protein